MLDCIVLLYTIVQTGLYEFVLDDSHKVLDLPDIQLTKS